MKYFKKFLIVGLFALLGVSFCNAGFLGDSASSGFSVNSSDGYKLVQGQSGYIKCLMKSNNYSLRDSLDGSTQNQTLSNNRLYCYYGDFYLATSSSSNSTANIYIIDISDLQSAGSCPSCPSCPSQYTSLECQTEYNLIPISEVTSNYCEVNFDLISPSDCPISEGTGSVNRSALYVNNIQYQGADNIYIDINDILTYSMTYSSGNAVIEVEGYDADEEYIENIIKVQEFHPDNDDFKLAFIGGLTLILPYVVVVLFVIFIRKLIRRIFKS